jgi:formylglycine-generating enzyme required for sulfatase activity
MVYIPGGNFVSINNEDTLRVKVKPFYIDRTEVSVSDFEKFISATGYVTDAERDSGRSSILPYVKVVDTVNINWRYDEKGNIRKYEDYNMPVVHLSYNDAEAFAKWAKKRLPLYYEWEFAAREGLRPGYRGYISKIAWYEQNSGLRIHKSKEKFANKFDLYDILGNVCEYVQLDQNGLNDKIGIKGGAFWFDKTLIKSDISVITGPESRSFYAGFRCVSDSLR